LGLGQDVPKHSARRLEHSLKPFIQSSNFPDQLEYIGIPGCPPNHSPINDLELELRILSSSGCRTKARDIHTSGSFELTFCGGP